LNLKQSNLIRIKDNTTTNVASVRNPADADTNTAAGMVTRSRLTGFNETSWDRWRNNTEEEILASAVRTISTNTTDQTNFNAKGLILVLTVAAVPTTETLTLTLQHKLTDGTYVAAVATTADADIGQHIIVSYPSGQADTYTSTFQQELHIDLPLPRTWRARVTHSASGNWTYTVEVMYLS